MKKLICAMLVLVLVFASAALAEKPAVDRAGNTITLPETVESIGAHAFQNCETLESVHLPENLRFIGEGARSEPALARFFGI